MSEIIIFLLTVISIVVGEQIFWIFTAQNIGILHFLY